MSFRAQYHHDGFLNLCTDIATQYNIPDLVHGSLEAVYLKSISDTHVPITSKGPPLGKDDVQYVRLTLIFVVDFS